MDESHLNDQSAVNIGDLSRLKGQETHTMTVTTESGGRQNAFPTETRPYIDDSVSYDG